MTKRFQHLSGDALREWRRLQRMFLGLRILARIRPTEQQTMFLWAGAVGFLGAWAAILFKLATHGVQWMLTGRHGGFVATFAELDLLRRFAVPTLGALLAGLLLMLGQRYFRRQATDYMEAIALGDGEVPVRASLIRSGAALLSIASGEAIGREGPLVQLAAVAASITGRFNRASPARRRLLVACGAAAGIAAAYHTPLAGALFVAEVVLGSLAMESLGPLLIASVVAALTVRSVEGADPLYAYSSFTVGPSRDILLYLLLGVLCGFAAAGWMRLLRWGKVWFAKVPGPVATRLMLGGLVVGLLAVWRPEVTGNGGSVIRGLLAGDFPWRFLALLLALKILATVAAFGSGAVGGVFTPSLFVGAVIGFLFAIGVNATDTLPLLNEGGFALIGMGAFLAAAAQAPIMAILMLFEMTLHYAIVLPLMVAAVAAYFTARGFGSEGLYTESLRHGPRSVFDRPLATVTVGELMRPPLRALSVETRFREIAALFLRSADRELWVTSRDGAFSGAIRLNDIRAFLREPDLADTVIAADIVNEDVPALTRDLNLPAALGQFTQSACDVLPVVDPATKHPVGSVGRADLLLVISELARREGTRGA